MTVFDINSNFILLPKIRISLLLLILKKLSKFFSLNEPLILSIVFEFFSEISYFNLYVFLLIFSFSSLIIKYF